MAMGLAVIRPWLGSHYRVRYRWGLANMSSIKCDGPSCVGIGVRRTLPDEPDVSSASAADLKFLHRLRQTHFRNFKSKSGTRIICLLVPLLLPKFVSEDAAMYHELRKRGTRISGRDFPALNPDNPPHAKACGSSAASNSRRHWH